jgi:hypothetical protein
MKIAVVDAGVGMDISNVATNDRAYDTNLGLSDKEIRAKVAKSNGGTITFGEATAGGLEAHNFNCDISIKTTTPGKKAKGNYDNTTTGNTLAGNSFMTTGGKTTTATMKHHASHDLDEEDDDDSFASSLTSINSTQSNAVGDAQDGLQTPDEQPDQEGKVSDFNPVKITAHQTKLITKAVGDLVMDPEDNDDAGSSVEDNEFGNGTGSLTIDLEPG